MKGVIKLKLFYCNESIKRMKPKPLPKFPIHLTEGLKIDTQAQRKRN